MVALRLLAPAKVNLTFEVLSRRADGFHEVCTVLQAIDLADELAFEDLDALSLTVTPDGSAPVEGNLILRAAGALRQHSHVNAGARISLRKRIPSPAGLGGGSSDAAATLLGLRTLWTLDLTDQILLDIAATLGSDVPFFIHGGTAEGSGRGERIRAVPSPQERFAVVLISRDMPPEGDMPPEADTPPDGKTSRLYGMLAPSDLSPDVARTAEAVRRLEAGEPMSGALFNAFDAVAARAYPGYAAAHDALLAAGARDVLLAGAGPALFALAVDEQEAGAIGERLAAGGLAHHVARLLPPWGLNGVEVE